MSDHHEGAGRERWPLADHDAYELIARHIGDVVLLLDAEGVIRFATPSVRETLGRDPADIVGRRALELAHPDDAATVLTARQDVVSEGRTRFRARACTASGDYHWFEVDGTVLLDGDGAVIGRVSSWRDVDGEVRAREALERSREHAEQAQRDLRNVMDAGLDPYVLLAAIRDDEGRVVDFAFADANRAALSVYGMIKEELLTHRLLELHPAARTTQLFQLYVRCVDEGVPVVLDDWGYPQDILDGRLMRYDVRAVKVGDAISQTWRNVTERVEEIERVRQSEERYRLISENTSDIVVHLRDGIVMWVSSSLTDALGWAVHDWAGRDVAEFIDPDTMAGLDAPPDPASSDGIRGYRIRVRDSGNRYHWLDARTHPYTDAEGRSDGIVASLRVIDDEVAIEDELQRRAQTDEVTGLLNRSEAFRRISDTLVFRPRTGTLTALLFCDVDDFKAVNDEFGHAAGDEVLRAVAERIHHQVRGADVVARIGGDEILVVLKGLHSDDQAMALAHTLQQGSDQPLEVVGRSLRVTLSIGVAMASPTDDADSLVARADRAMYEAKRAGKNRVVLL